MIEDTNFLEHQLSFSRVDIALEKNIERIEKRCTEVGCGKFDGVYLRAFKEEGKLELWKWNNTEFVLYDTFPICNMSGVLGPKKREGDLQVPEGFYEIKVFNPMSNYLLSLGLNYPNERDQIVNTPPRGGDIYIHGKCVSAGCLAMEDLPIQEIYSVAMLAKSAGQEHIRVHIFPFKMDKGNMRKHLRSASPELKDFWESLLPMYEQFEKEKRLPNFSISTKGKYIVE